MYTCMHVFHSRSPSKASVLSRQRLLSDVGTITRVIEAVKNSSQITHLRKKHWDKRTETVEKLEKTE